MMIICNRNSIIMDSPKEVSFYIIYAREGIRQSNCFHIYNI